jgi:hypothetical protein
MLDHLPPSGRQNLSDKILIRHKPFRTVPQIIVVFAGKGSSSSSVQTEQTIHPASPSFDGLNLLLLQKEKLAHRS